MAFPKTEVVHTCRGWRPIILHALSTLATDTYLSSWIRCGVIVMDLEMLSTVDQYSETRPIKEQKVS